MPKRESNNEMFLGKKVINLGMGEWTLFLLLSQVIVWSSIKYLVGVGLALIYLPLIQGWLYSTIGGLLGIIIFVFFGVNIQKTLLKRWPAFFSNKRFSRKNRILVRIRQKGGLIVISLLTPFVLSIPVGCILATTFIHNHWKIITYQSLSLILWSILIFGGRYYLGEAFPVM